eukprot:TRINITY_DN11810_c0_g1_i2.p1 TRINITY_DN11810_c0_g1~~TRINITY_DN11810_c0_g1_i2.p1  ORF type:complete len:324 (-),score=56.65 TRINITY_DN11810_c0_g1_i2:1107-2045(-)
MTEQEAPVPTVQQHIGVSFSGLGFTDVSTTPCGRFCFVGGRRGAYLIDLEEPWDTKSKLKWGSTNTEVLSLDVSEDSWVAASSLQQISLWQRVEDKWSQERCFTPHGGRPALSLKWSWRDPNILCSASSDKYLKVWDRRDTRTSARKMTFNVDSPHLVRWNRQDAFLLLSAHAGKVCLWDLRRETMPVSCVFASTSKLSEIDWSYNNNNQFITCDNSSKFKIWDIKSSRESVGNVFLGHPVSSVQWTPFGHGIWVSYKGESKQELYLFSSSSLSPVLVDTFCEGVSVSGATAKSWRICTSGCYRSFLLFFET